MKTNLPFKNEEPKEVNGQKILTCLEKAHFKEWKLGKLLSVWVNLFREKGSSIIPDFPSKIVKALAETVECGGISILNFSKNWGLYNGY